jgi:nitroimidazol reductase NimA-like FMN-containing flavoprotein (pyridoxamine 5'-phosphate oxidase superfamily)
MVIPEGPTVFEEIPEQECLSLLASSTFGRLAVVSDGAPDVFPVNYFFDKGRVAIRTAWGTKLAAAALARVAFEVDSVEDSDHTGWSVVVHGTAFDISESLDEVSETMRSSPVSTWLPGDKSSWIRIEPSAITGRRVRRA